jgi:asparagine synthase (glutamine-hydrolysing)
LFGGYNRHLFAACMGQYIQSLPHPVRRILSASLRILPSRGLDGFSAFLRAHAVSSLPPAMGEKVARLAQFIAASSGQEAYLGMISQWTSDESVPLDRPANKPALGDFPMTSLPQQMMCWDMQNYLPDDILVKVDRAAMASSLETRVPFLDYRLVEFALATPLQYKIRAGRSKWLLRELLSKYLPSAFFDRPKQGFTLPLSEWLRGPLREWAESLLSPSRLAGSGLIDAMVVRRTWEEHLSGRRNHQRAIWTILMLQSWLVQDGALRNASTRLFPTSA